MECDYLVAGMIRKEWMIPEARLMYGEYEKGRDQMRTKGSQYFNCKLLLLVTVTMISTRRL